MSLQSAYEIQKVVTSRGAVIGQYWSEDRYDYGTGFSGNIVYLHPQVVLCAGRCHRQFFGAAAADF